jgi:hypothetical protein
MTRIFTTLALTNALALFLTFGLGCWSKLAGGIHDPAGRVYLLHFLFGIFTGIGTLLVHCLIFTYFLGTGRWVREVTLAYGLPDEPLYKRTRELKRLAFPIALAAMAITIVTSAAGAGVQLQGWSWTIHFSLGVATLVINVATFRREYLYVAENATIIDRVLAEVDRVRAERGLPPNADALAEAGQGVG